MLLDANLLLYAVDARSPFNAAASAWLGGLLNGDVRVGIPWQTIGAFVRISTHPRISERPLTGEQAWGYIERWLEAAPVWIPAATEMTARRYGELAKLVSITGNLATDGLLAALALEHGLELLSADTDFARFPGLRWRNPLMG